MRIRLFNVKYSPNLGDGLLSECLEQALIACGADADGTYSADLSARTRYCPGSSSRGALLSALDKLPALVRGLAVQVPLTLLMRRRWRPHYVASLAGVDAVVVGGGNLFTDMDLNFPTKLANAIGEAAARDLPVAIYGVGVGKVWSTAGLAMVRRALQAANLVSVTVRDQPSADHFARHFGSVITTDVGVVPDPGLLASRVLVTQPPHSGAVGLCITSAIAVRYHSPLAVSDEALGTFYTALAQRLADAGRHVIAFTNGSPEDEAFCDGVEGTLKRAGAVRHRVADPKELASLAGGFDALVAHRMHALVAGYSFGVPIFPLEWDHKVNAFAASVGATAPVVAAPDIVDVLFERVSAATPAAPGATLDAAMAGVEALYASLRDAAR